MVAAANAPKPVKVGDNARGGIAFHVTNGGMNGLVAHAEDIPVMGGVMHFEAARMQGQDHKLYWRRWSDGLTGWSDIYVDGPNRSLHNARCIRKF